MFFLEALRLLSYDRIMSCQTKWLCLPLWNRVRTKRLCILGVHICWRWLCQTHWCYCQTLSERNTKQQFTLSEHVHFLHSTGRCRNAFWVFLKQKKALQGKAWGRLLSRKKKAEKAKPLPFHELRRYHHFEVIRISVFQLQHLHSYALLKKKNN